MKDKRRWDSKGFTLIEIIASLVLVGIMAAVAGLGLVKITEGFVFTRASVTAAQKGQIALVRIEKELNRVSDITFGSPTSISYVSHKGGIAGNYSIRRSGVNLNLNNDILTDNVEAFILKYYDSTGAAAAPANAQIIQFELTLLGPENTQASFVNSVTPRNR